MDARCRDMQEKGLMITTVKVQRVLCLCYTCMHALLVRKQDNCRVSYGQKLKQRLHACMSSSMKLGSGCEAPNL